MRGDALLWENANVVRETEEAREKMRNKNNEKERRGSVEERKNDKVKETSKGRKGDRP
jgi:hypothetical protein